MKKLIFTMMVIVLAWSFITGDVIAEDKYPKIKENGTHVSINAERTVYLSASWSRYDNSFTVSINNFGLQKAIHVNPGYFTLVTVDKSSHAHTASEKLTLQLQPDTSTVGNITFDGNTKGSIPKYIVYDSPGTGRIVVYLMR